jgi:hypothetical protein
LPQLSFFWMAPRAISAQSRVDRGATRTQSRLQWDIQCSLKKVRTQSRSHGSISRTAISVVSISVVTWLKGIDTIDPHIRHFAHGDGYNEELVEASIILAGDGKRTIGGLVRVVRDVAPGKTSRKKPVAVSAFRTSPPVSGKRRVDRDRWPLQSGKEADFAGVVGHR